MKRVPVCTNHAEIIIIMQKIITQRVYDIFSSEYLYFLRTLPKLFFVFTSFSSIKIISLIPISPVFVAICKKVFPFFGTEGMFTIGRRNKNLVYCINWSPGGALF